MPSSNDHVRVGVGVLVRDPKHPHKIFAGIRKNSHGNGTLALPGGHLEKYESWESCAIREVLEETGLHIDHVAFGSVTNDIMKKEGKHYVTIFMLGEFRNMQEGEDAPRPQNLEPEKCAGWDSFSWDELRALLAQEKEENGGSGRGVTLFGPLRQLVLDSPPQVLKFLANPP